MSRSVALTIFPAAPQADWTVTVVRQEPAREGLPLADLGEPQLVSAALAGQPGAFDLIVERHRRGVYQLCFRFMNSHEDASDLTQDVFLRAFRGLKGFRSDASISTWLYRIGVNVCLNRVGAKRPRTEPIDEREYVDHGESASDQLLRGEQSARVRSAVAELPSKQRVVLMLRVYQELSYQEIADIVGTSVGAAKANVFHALQNLKKRLGNEIPSQRQP